VEDRGKADESVHRMALGGCSVGNAGKLSCSILLATI
jgi:hypothetical protein